MRERPDVSKPVAVVRVADLNEVSHAFLNQTSLEARKLLGQYMTPRVLRERLLDVVPLAAGMRVLDPGCGTGEFLRSALDRVPGISATGWDVDPEVLRYSRELVPEADLIERSTLDPYHGEQFDLVIGNPPYFQFKPPAATKRYYAQVISGRPNIFAFFFQAGLEAVRDGGHLAYVVPPSMNNGAYFSALRDYITNCASVEHVEVHGKSDHFIDAQTAIQIVALQKRAARPRRRHVFVRDVPDARFRRTIFCEDADALSSEFTARSTLWALGYEAVTGTVVWNQQRERLRSDAGSDAVLLLWAHNLKNDTIVLYEDHKRPQFVVHGAPLIGPAIVVNRIVGAVGAGDFRCALVPDGMRFLGENHLNVIRAREGIDQLVDWEILLGLLRNQRTIPRIRLLTGNTQMSASELNHLLPLG